LMDESNEVVALATGLLPARAPAAPDLSGYPLRAHFPEPLAVEQDGSRIGDIYRTTPFVYSDEIHDDYLARVRETLPLYVADRAVHPGYLVKLTMHDAVSSYARPSPGVHVGFSVQHYGIAHVGDTLSSSGSIVGVFEKRGRQYVESEQLVIANGQQPIAMVRRTAISSFAARPFAAESVAAG